MEEKFYTNKENVEKFLMNLLKEKEVPFHIEEDFKFAFAFKIIELGYGVTLEYPRKNGNGHIDLVVWENEETRTPIALFEFKYKTKESVIRANHGIPLPNDSGQNDNRYMFFDDIKKLEGETNFKDAKKYCIFLTNDKSYQNAPRGETAGRNFYLNPEREIYGPITLTYYGDRHRQIELNGTYPQGTFSWGTYNYNFLEVVYPFYYLVVKVY